MRITATDSKGKSSYKDMAFIKTVHELRITMEHPMNTDARISKMVMNIARSIPNDAVFTVLVTNNANDATPIWEDVTQNIATRFNYLFNNTSVNATNGFNFIIIVRRGASGTGGHISSIGGAFE